MKVSVNWLKQFMDIQLPVEELVERIGAQLGAVEEVIDIGAKYQGIVIAKVVTCEKHPNADKLSLCTIDDGGVVQGVPRNESGHVQVVCGAPNVRAGLSVAWLPPGSTVPSSHGKDPFVLEARELRGVISNGMLASASELAITDDHGGLLEIDIEAAPGTPFADVYDLNDHIIDIENKMFTHRPDCFGVLGVAREIAGISNTSFMSPEWYLKSLDRIKPGHTRLPLGVRNEADKLVPRLMAIVIADVKVAPSPIIIQTYLSRIGLRPINNIVDVTNYLMILTGQPLHAYDYDKIKERSGDTPTLMARNARDGEKIALLNGKTVELDFKTVVIATDKQAVGIAGVMGGADTEVDDDTKNIIIECANFDMYAIRKTSMKYGLFTDAVTRFNKGQSPLQTDMVLEESVATMQYVSGGHVASDVYDVHTEIARPKAIKVTAKFINARLGLTVSAHEMAARLKNVEFEVEVHGDELSVTAPFWRTDLHIAEDIVEEIGRLIGYDHLPLELPKRHLQPASPNELLDLKRAVRNALSAAGANELLTYSFVHGNLLEKSGQDVNKAFRLSNALSPDLQYYRISLTPSLLEKVHPNSKSGYEDFVLYEIGKGHEKGVDDQLEPAVPHEEQLLAVVCSFSNLSGPAFYQAKKYLHGLLDSLRVLPESVAFEACGNDESSQLSAPFDTQRTARVVHNGEIIGFVGEYRGSVRKALKLPAGTAGFELRLSALMHGVQAGYAPLPRYPKVEQDICLKVSSDMAYQSLHGFVRDEVARLQPQHSKSSLEPVDIYQREDDKDHKQVTFRLTIASYEKTLTSEEINDLLDEVAASAKASMGAERI